MYTVIEPGTPDSLLSPTEPGQPDEEDQEEVNAKDGERQLSKALARSPVLKFVTRRDLFSFLSSAGVSNCINFSKINYCESSTVYTTVFS